MIFRPKRVVRVTTEQELDSALASADQVIVEGDDRLLSYAVTKGSSDPQNRVAVELAGRSIFIDGSVQRNTLLTGDDNTISTRWANPDPSPAEPITANEFKAGARRPQLQWTEVAEATQMRPASPPHPSPASHPRMIVISLFLSVAFLTALGGYLAFQLAGPTPTPPLAPRQLPQQLRPLMLPSPNPPPLPPSPTPPQLSPSLSPSSNIPAVLQTLAWPAVSIVAIIVLFFIARQAVDQGGMPRLVRIGKARSRSR